MATQISTPLKAFRLSLGAGREKISQERIARMANTSLQTYRSAESGEEIYLSTALSIWKAINEVRRAKGLDAVSFEQLWNK